MKVTQKDASIEVIEDNQSSEMNERAENKGESPHNWNRSNHDSFRQSNLFKKLITSNGSTRCVGSDALMNAIRQNDIYQVELLINRYPQLALLQDPTTLQTPLQVAIRLNHLDVATVLCRLPTVQQFIETEDSKGNTALHYAVCRSFSLVKLLIDHKAKVNVINSYMQTPLVISILASKDNMESLRICRILLNAGEHANVYCGRNTLLDEAVKKNMMQIAGVLIHYGACMSIEDANGLTIFDKVDGKKLKDLIRNIAYPPKWIDANGKVARPNCMMCNKKFSLVYRKHHCRHCGRLCCLECCNASVPLYQFPEGFPGRLSAGGVPIKTPQRVCLTCKDIFKERNLSLSPTYISSQKSVRKFPNLEWLEMTKNITPNNILVDWI